MKSNLAVPAPFAVGAERFDLVVSKVCVNETYTDARSLSLLEGGNKGFSLFRGTVRNFPNTNFKLARIFGSRIPIKHLISLQILFLSDSVSLPSAVSFHTDRTSLNWSEECDIEELC
jgi:hypothetical protein